MIFCAAGLPDLEERAIFAFIPETVKVDALRIPVFRFPCTRSQPASLRAPNPAARSPIEEEQIHASLRA